MAITLEEAKKNVQDDLQMGVIDEFQKSNWILEHIPFDDAVSPTGGGATPSYSYTRLKTQPTAEFREINKEYTPSEVTKERHTVSNLTPFQQDLIREVVCQQADFETENADEINTVLQSYSINGVSMQFGNSWNVFTDKGVAMKRDVYAMLCQTGLCCRLAR